MKTLLTLTATLIGLSCSRNIVASAPGPARVKPGLPSRPVPLDASDPAAVRQVFNRQLKVFGIRVLATRRTPDPKLQHAAAILAGYLDNARDGRADTPRVVAAMVRQKAPLVMFGQREGPGPRRTVPASAPTVAGQGLVHLRRQVV